MKLAKCIFICFFFVTKLTPSIQQNPWSPLSMLILTEDANEGDDLVVECTYETPYMTAFDVFRTFSWMKDESLIYDGARLFNYDVTKYIVLTEPNWVGINSQLVVKNSSRFDAGKYSCVFDENGASATNALKVNYPPSNGYPACRLNLHGNVSSFSIGSAIEFECLSDGYPYVNLSWYVRTLDGNVTSIEGRDFIGNHFVRSKVRIDLNYTLNTKTLICISTITSDPFHNSQCEIGPIIVATDLIETDDDVITTSSPAPRMTSSNHSHDLMTTVVSEAENVKTTDVYQTKTSTQRTNKPDQKVGNEKDGTVLYKDNVIASIQCECQMDQDYFQLLLFVMIPVLVISMLFNTFLCIKGFKVKSYSPQVASEEMDNIAIIGNRRTETIIRQERETASNEYSLGDIYAAIDYTNTTGNRLQEEDYDPHYNDPDYEFDDTDYFDNDGDYHYSHAVYDEPPPEDHNNDENANFYFDVPNTATEQKPPLGIEDDSIAL